MTDVSRTHRSDSDVSYPAFIPSSTVAGRPDAATRNRDAMMVGARRMKVMSAPQLLLPASLAALPERLKAARAALLLNISPNGTAPGTVVASPSQQDPDYWYHWVRDGALVMNAVVTMYEQAAPGTEKTELRRMLIDFIELSRRQQISNAKTGLGEPKFHVDGRPYDGPWGRPQNDGPALRAIAMTRFAKLLLAEGEEKFVRETLYDAELPAYRIIKADAEFVSHHQTEASFDYWEEVEGFHFNTRLLQRRALLDTADLAQRLGDPGAADWYRARAEKLGADLETHWNPSKGYIELTIDRRGGLDYKNSGLDVATILGVLHVAHAKDRFAAADERVLATAERLEREFKSIYDINKNGKPGVAIGRYSEDRYTGYNSDGLGNPWVLATNALAELHYLVAGSVRESGIVEVTATSQAFYQALPLSDVDKRALMAGERIRRGEPRFEAIVRALIQKGDQFIERTLAHGFPNGSLSEQMDRRTGFMTGARDLTWSYASLITAAWARDAIVDNGRWQLSGKLTMPAREVLRVWTAGLRQTST